MLRMTTNTATSATAATIDRVRGPMDATVRWTRDNLAGVEFHVALDAAVVSYFEAFIPAAA